MTAGFLHFITADVPTLFVGWPVLFEKANSDLRQDVDTEQWTHQLEHKLATFDSDQDSVLCYQELMKFITEGLKMANCKTDPDDQLQHF